MQRKGRPGPLYSEALACTGCVRALCVKAGADGLTAG
jgi:hypothetical protein